MSTAGRTWGFSWPILIAFAALAAPRVVLHDLGVIEEGSVVNGLLVGVPPACWVAAVLWKRPPRPFVTVVVIGALYGVFLAIGHQLLWDAAFAADTPSLSGSSTGVQEVVLRAAAILSSLVTGTLVGVVAAAVAVLLGRTGAAVHRRRGSTWPPPAGRGYRSA